MVDPSADPRGALRVPAVRRFILGRAVATLGSQMLAVAVGWDIYRRTHSMLALGLVGLVQVLPVVILALPAGQLVDRVNRRTITLLASLVHGFAALAMAFASIFDAPLAVTYGALLVIGVARSAWSPASGALFAQITPPIMLANANAWRSTTLELASIVGPALAGMLIAVTGVAEWVYIADLVGAFVFAGITLTLPNLPPPPRATGPLRSEVTAGLRFVFRTELLLAAITLDLFAVLFGGATALLPVFAEDILHVGPSGLGWLRAAPAIGAMAMALLTTRLPPWRRSGRVLLATVVGFGAATIVFGLSTSFIVSFIALLFTGVFDNVSVVIRLTLEQLIVPDALRGRVGAIHNVFIGLSNEMGELESGVAAALLGPVPAVALGGAVTIAVVGFVAIKWPGLRRLGRLGDIEPAPIT